MQQFSEYIDRSKWKLCAIDAGKKAPTYAHWNTQPKTPGAIDACQVAGMGAGLLHALSGTCAIDLDNLDLARPWLAERGIDIDALLSAPNAVRIDSGRHGRAKLLYKLGRPMRTLKPKDSGLELRCATADGKSVQDVLPPSIHPDTKKPYAWKYGEELLGHWSVLPPIPAPILALWRELSAEAGPVARLEGVATTPTIGLERLKSIVAKRDPDCEYDEWIKIGMALHHEGGGSQEAFDIWADWSRGIGRKAYPGDALLITHWHSFKVEGNGRAVTGASLVAEEAAPAEDFEPITEAEAAAVPEAETTAGKIKAKVKELKQNAQKALEARLVYVAGDDKYFDTEKHRLLATDHAIEHTFTHMMPTGKNGKASPVGALKISATKRTVEEVAFHPGEQVIFTGRDGDQYANRYRNRMPEPLEPTPEEEARIDWLFNRIDDPVFKYWLLQFFAHVVQFPGRKIKSAPLIWSRTQGNGKTTLLRVIPSLLVGTRYSVEVNCSLLNSDFNDYLLDAWHVNLTEFRAGTRGERSAITAKIKEYISEDTVALHPKGGRGYSLPNHFFVTATSNDDDAAMIDDKDRRLAVHEMHAEQFTEAEQKYIYTEFLNTQRAAAVVRHYFLNYPILDFSPSAKAPMTQAKTDMAGTSEGADAELLRIAFEEGTEPLDQDVVITARVAEYVRKHIRYGVSTDKIGKLLTRAPFNGVSKVYKFNGNTFRATILRNHSQWINASGSAIQAHIDGLDGVDILA